ncbi:hypothetical protein [Sphingomonas montanisoli]|uniref:Uncharacterized protein n=1 Tax=Sphingomonas montanisoli TaxID=2606412 RepID=A0A5D9C6M4_9SPHN|nr:hypothetical protein [Sphingomonas montanisoli]TZG27173.1 hypothetical protein FYJ91_05975 [Sphingomonas montanisoli]
MAIPRPSRPSAFLADFKAFLTGDQRHKVPFAILAMLMPCIIIAGFYKDSLLAKPQKRMIYVQYYKPDRTDEEIRKQNIADQKVLDAAREERRKQYQRLADRLGIDTKN